MTSLLRLVIPLPPVSWKRAVDTKIKGKRKTPKAMEDWQNDVSYLAAIAWRGKPIDYAVELRSTSIIKRPKRISKEMRYLIDPEDPDGRIFRPTYPDGDNCMKNVADALVKGSVLLDDRFVVVWVEVDCYAAKGEDPKTLIELRVPDKEMLHLIDDSMKGQKHHGSVSPQFKRVRRKR